MPDRPLYAIGDVHGRADLLAVLLGRIRGDARDRRAEASALVIGLGDYVDRGPESGGALALAMEWNAAEAPETAWLMGNHERMLLDALDDPETAGRRWLKHGGAETLIGLGVPVPGRGASLPVEALRGRLPRGADAWLRARPLWLRSGDVVCVHAGLDPRAPPDGQADETMLFGSPAFRRTPRRDGLWVVHGHTVVPEPEQRDRRIAVDTGAYHSGCLTAAALYPGEPVRFLHAEE